MCSTLHADPAAAFALLQSSGLDFKPAEVDAEYALNVLWLDKSIGLAVDQVFKAVRTALRHAEEFGKTFWCLVGAAEHNCFCTQNSQHQKQDTIIEMVCLHILTCHAIVLQNQKSPITEYFFWPKTDAWEALNVSIEAKDWISER